MWTAEQLEKANSIIKTTDIKGKDYAEVPQRIKVLRIIDPMASIETEMISNADGVCVFRAVVTSSDGKVIGTGTAYEKEGSTFINKTSYIENCETSAVGRALAMCGIGIDTSIASKEEVENAKAQQEQAKPNKTKDIDNSVAEAQYRTKVMAYINRHNMSEEAIAKICKCYKVEKITDLTQAHCQHYINALQKNGGNIDE